MCPQTCEWTRPITAIFSCPGFAWAASTAASNKHGTACFIIYSNAITSNPIEGAPTDRLAMSTDTRFGATTRLVHRYGFGIIIALLVVSTVMAWNIQENFSERS